MDELEISGKRYISTRRAAKENKYHSDYIGQLIRGGKVEGQKVGRSWYVVADSLTEYLGKEGGAKTPVSAQVLKRAVRETVGEVEETIEEKKVETEETPEEVVLDEIKKEEPEIVEDEIEEKEEPHSAVKINKQETKKEVPVIKSTRSTLRYIADDGPLYPRTQPREKTQIKVRAVEPVIEEAVEETVYIEEEPVTIIERPRRAKKNISLFIARGGTVLAVGVITIGAVVALSAFVVSTTTVKGETASVSYSLTGM